MVPVVIVAAVCHSLMLLLEEDRTDNGRLGVVKIAEDGTRGQVLNTSRRRMVTLGRHGARHTSAHVLCFVFEICLQMGLLFELNGCDRVA